MREAMDDRGRFWLPVPDWRTASLDGEGWRARRIPDVRQTLVSGDLGAARSVLAPGLVEVGLWEIAESGAAVVRIARDRALIVSISSPPMAAPGWHDRFAVSPCDDLYAVLEISGASVADVVAEATAVDFTDGSRSAALLFAGVSCLLYRSGPQTARLHVESPFAAYIWTWLAGIAARGAETEGVYL